MKAGALIEPKACIILKAFNDVKITTRLFAGYAIVLILLLAIVMFAFQRIEYIGISTQKLASSSLEKVMLSREAQNAAQSAAANLHSLFLLENRTDRIPVYNSIDKDNRRRNLAISKLVLLESGIAETNLLNEVELARSNFEEKLTKTVNSIELNHDVAQRLMIGQTLPALKEMLNKLDELVQLQNLNAQIGLNKIHEQQMHSRYLIVALGFAALLAAGLSAFFISRSIKIPLEQTVKYADAIARGQLDIALIPQGNDEITTLVIALERMRIGILGREEQISSLAYNDTLTGLPNRVLFKSMLQNAVNTTMGNKQPLSILMLDLDRFRQVNDILGHTVGDELLQRIALRLRSELKSNDTLSRLGGDEFALLLPEQDQHEATAVAKRLINLLEAPLTIRGQVIDVSASIGIACCPEQSTLPDDLSSKAEIAMYNAKSRSTGFAVFHKNFSSDSAEILSLLSQLRKAIEHDELMLYFQPKISLATGKCKQVEALIRWNHPERGFIPPDHFIPFAESTGYIRTITHWVIKHACMKLNDWANAKIEIGICINISTRDLIHQDLPVFIQEALLEYGVDASRLSLEITESALMEDPKRSLAALNQLHNMRLDLSIDDFGTGYSSLGYLKRLPVKELKIDKSFVLGMGKDSNDASIVRATIELAHNLGLRIVAEGIENKQTLDLLRSYGCDDAQGYFISPPLPAEKFQAWLSERISGVEINASVKKSGG